MNQEIKFRGIKSHGKGWVYGSFIKNSIDCACIIDENAEQFEINEETLGQKSNWLSHLSEKDIYAGDIIKHDLLEGLGMPYTTNHKTIVNTIEGNFGYYTNVRLIGNKYENPELL